jgi:hypothetical protein
MGGKAAALLLVPIIFSSSQYAILNGKDYLCCCRW